MRLHNRMRLLWIGLALAIEYGFHLGQTFLLSWQSVCPLFFWLLLFLVVCICALLQWKRRKRVLALLVYILLPVSGLCYGCMRGSADTVNLTTLYGIPITADGTIEYVKTGQGQAFLLIQLDKITTSNSAYTCLVECAWHGRMLQSPGVSSTCVIRGILYTKQVRDKVTNQMKSELVCSGDMITEPKQLPSLFDKIRKDIDTALVGVGNLSHGTANIAENLLYGGGTVDAQTKQWFLQAGSLHVFAASGANVALVDSSLGRLLIPVLVLCRFPSVVLQSVRLFFLWFFTGLCSFTPSITRASVMAGYRHIGEYFGRETNLLDSLLFTAIVMAVSSPATTLSPGALLSFSATAAVYRGMTLKLGIRVDKGRNKVTTFLRRVAHVGLQALINNIVVDLAMLPLTIALFHQITPYSLASNLIIEPMLAILLPFLLLYVIACLSLGALPFYVSFPSMLSYLPTEGIQLLLKWVQLVSSQSNSLLTTSNISGFDVALYYGLLLASTSLITHRYWVFDRLCEKMNKVETPVI